MTSKGMFVAGAVCAILTVAAEEPFCALRFGYRYTQPDKWPGMRMALERNRALKVCKRHDWGWALWNIDGLFGILDTPRTDCTFEDFHGHKLDRKALDLLRKYK